MIDLLTTANSKCKEGSAKNTTNLNVFSYWVVGGKKYHTSCK